MAADWWHQFTRLSATKDEGGGEQSAGSNTGVLPGYSSVHSVGDDGLGHVDDSKGDKARELTAIESIQTEQSLLVIEPDDERGRKWGGPMVWHASI